ncbi:hypothetical protein M885DRAFT_612143 [Pelagophyceae sp. CCMP2097]|nr:hypothetical protein M885DRAFT_612143 [Pelagophyceae sp. CCMP2097]
MSTKVRQALKTADALAAAYLERDDASAAAVEAVLCSIGEWPTQARPNVAPDGKAVTGMCLGVVCVLGGVGMQMSIATKLCPNVSRLVAAFTTRHIPARNGAAFPFSSLQVNYNYAARKHVDGNNIGPSYIVSLGNHAGGALWVADTFVEIDGVMRGGGGPAIVDCRGEWKLFNGNAEHETQPFHPGQRAGRTQRISIVAFTHASYNKLPADAANDLAKLGFTAGSSDGVELPFFKSFRLDKAELSGEALDRYLELRAARSAAKRPPSARGAVAVECNGYTAGKGAGWISFARGTSTDKKRRIDSFFAPKAKAAAAQKGSLPFDLPTVSKNSTSTGDTNAVIDGEGVVTIHLPNNRTGLWVVELAVTENSTAIVALERFDVYKHTAQQTKALVKYVDGLERGRVILIAITDTAMAKTRPLSRDIYDALGELGAPADMEPLGYRRPFAMIGAKGLPRGNALVVQETTKVIVRLEATVRLDAEAAGAVSFVDTSIEKTDITQHILLNKDAASAPPPESAPPATNAADGL